MKGLADDKTFIVRYFHISYYKNNGENSLKWRNTTLNHTGIICTKKRLDRPEFKAAISLIQKNKCLFRSNSKKAILSNFYDK